ncbi:MAG: hypothetical protein ACYCYO_20605, partial [Bacilli bacterium]
LGGQIAKVCWSSAHRQVVGDALFIKMGTLRGAVRCQVQPRRVMRCAPAQTLLRRTRDGRSA